MGLALSTFAGLEAIHLLDRRFESRDLPVCRVVTRKLVIALTFDDGPDPRYTPAVLHLLSRFGARATFFVIGRKASRHPGLVAEEAQRGMEIAGHTWSHRRIDRLSPDQMRVELDRTERALASFGTSSLFRAPFGSFLPEQAEAMRAWGVRPVHWSVAVDHLVDGLGLSAGEAVRWLSSEVRPGDILLFHDAPLGSDDPEDPRRATLEVLARLLPALERVGYRFVTVSELLRTGEPVLARPRPWFWQDGFACPPRTAVTPGSAAPGPRGGRLARS
ncbi:MAG TPA: polysaccharide deacetylase family protein [Actinomycetota bacterium]|nr:polysaccharide deacetylase family protein [Actinomycetota bacterium]